MLPVLASLTRPPIIHPPLTTSLQRLVGSVPDMSALTQLQALQLQNNGFTGELPPMPASMRNLNLEYNRFRWVAGC